MTYRKTIFNIWRPTEVLNSQHFDFLSNVHLWNGNSHMHTKFDQNRIIHGWDMEIKLFSKRRPSAILNLRKCTIFIVAHHSYKIPRGIPFARNSCLSREQYEMCLWITNRKS